jgi:uncharacterized protein (DUF2267 family)
MGYRVPAYFGRPSAASTITTLIFGLAVVYGSVVFASTEGTAGVAAQLRLWWIASAAVLAVVTPHILFPDLRFASTILVAPTPAKLLAREFGRGLPLLLVLLVPTIVIPVTARLPFPDLIDLIFGGALGVAAIWWLAIQMYVRLGAVSQLWQEGRRGAWFEETGMRARMPIAMPRGSYPVLGVTAGLFLAGAAVAVAWGMLDRMEVAAPGLFAAAVMTGWVALFQFRWWNAADAFIYRTQAFFNEMYRAFGAAREADREPLPYASVYWVPRKIRPAVWSQLRQMDRRLPLGRLMASAIVLFWLLLYQEGYGNAAIAVLALMSLAKNAAPFMMSRTDASPPGFHLRLHSPTAWAMTRFFMSLRWTFPFAAALVVASLFSATLTTPIVVAWIILDVALALVAGTVLAFTVEHAFRRRFA